MIAYLRGKVLYKQAPQIILDVNNIGYELLVPMSTYYNIPEVGHEMSVYCYQHIREDANTLYGFNNLDERKLFMALLKTNGVGPNLALTILSNFNIGQFLSVINNNDNTALVKLPGVGKKTADRLLLELKDRLKKIFTNHNFENEANIVDASSGVTQFGASNSSHTVMDAICALESLGYKNNEIQRVVNKLVSKDNNFNTSEDLIKAALREFN